jgi:hypothetical protein
MKPKHEVLSCHPKGESEMVPVEGGGQTVPVDTYGSRVHVEWDPHMAVTGRGSYRFSSTS